jgi:ketosteroid isomerase-like protein
MNTRAVPLVTVLLAVAVTVPGCARKTIASREQDIVAQIYELERQTRDAAIQRDAAFSQRMLSDDYLGVGPLGQFVTKADTIAARQHSQVKFDSIRISEMKIRVFGDTAVVTARAEVKGSDLGEDFSGPYLYTRVWSKVNNEWKTVSYQATVSR